MYEYLAAGEEEEVVPSKGGEGVVVPSNRAVEAAGEEKA